MGTVDPMMKRTKIALVAGTALLALAGVGGGVAFAAGGDSGAPTTDASLTAATTSTTPSTGATPKAHRVKSLLARVEHGEVTLHTKKGDETVDIQRGQVSAVTATTVTVRSTDGFTATYTIGSGSKVFSKGKASTIGAVHDGDRVAVRATNSANTLTVDRLGDAGPAPAK